MFRVGHHAAASYPSQKITMVGGGIIAALETYFAWLDAKQHDEPVRITVYEKNVDISATTTSNIVPSLTPDEILSVVPRGQELINKLKILFSEPGGIRVNDARHVNDNPAAKHFKSAVLAYSSDQAGHEARTQTLLQLGKRSMELWQEIYDSADAELKHILVESNFNPCKEIDANGEQSLHQGYRIDLIYDVENAGAKAAAMQSEYQNLGYANCRPLTPDEVITLDPYLADFCRANSHLNTQDTLEWNNAAHALWRPGGCLDTQVFLPKFYEYLQKVMGKYVNDEGVSKNCLQMKFDRQVKKVITTHAVNHSEHITGLRFTGHLKTKHNARYQKADYVFCPGESVGTLNKLGFNEPAYCGFAGTSLMLRIPLDNDGLKKFSKFNHCMEVHQEGIVLAWQARIHDGAVMLGVAGTKAFHSDQKPGVNQQFAQNRNLLQLNMINDVLPELISIALGKDTKGKKLTANDLHQLEKSGIARRWVGVRAVAYDGFPTLGRLFKGTHEVENARCTTHLGSGGVSFAPAVVTASRMAGDAHHKPDALLDQVLNYADVRRNRK